MEGGNVWTCEDCYFQNNYETDPDMCNICCKPNPNTPKNAPSNPKPVEYAQPVFGPPKGTSIVPRI